MAPFKYGSISLTSSIDDKYIETSKINSLDCQMGLGRFRFTTSNARILLNTDRK